MAAKGKAAKRTTGGGARSGFWAGAMAVLRVTALLLAGTVVGYCWRSFAPLALPFESRLVADKKSTDIRLEQDNAAMARRLKTIERERDDLARRLASLEVTQKATERELADLKIKSLLTSAME
jgi:septal ring factor EnvC (AmiA/AmiB activator)